MDIKKILELHEKYLEGLPNGEKADLRYASLAGADLSGASLRYADFRYANLRYANLAGTDLAGADLTGADLSDADLRDANLSGADLSDADFRYANLRDANIRYADFHDGGLIVLQLPIWVAYVTKSHTRIGCEHHDNEKWASFDDDTISKMDSKALDWWKIHKPLIMAAIEAVNKQ